MSSHALLLAACATSCFLLAIALLNPLARRIGWLDHPDARKQHAGPVPLTGGAGIVIALALAALLVQPWPEAAYGLAIGGMLVFVVGAADDRFPIRARYRFLAQVTAALAIASFGGDAVRLLGEAFYPSPLGLGMLAIPFTLVAVAGVVNAYNMSDGLDGLCGGYALIAVLWFIVAAASIARIEPDAVQALYVLLPVAGALLGFLILNLRSPMQPRATLFLGDGGSMMLGLIIAWASIHLSQRFGTDGLPPVTAVWIIALPLTDMFICIIRRVRAGLTPMTPDRRHLHHLMLARGHTPESAVARLHLLAFGSGGIGVAGWLAEVPDYLMFWGLVVCFAVYCRFVLRFWASADAAVVSAPAVQRRTQTG